MAYVYQHIRLDTDEVFYIGIGSDTDGKYKRAYEIKRRLNPHWHNVINKTKHKVEILTDVISWEEACEEEKRLIKLYGRKDLKLGTLVNLTDGGEGICGTIFSEESKKRMSESRKGRIVTEETRQKLREAGIGKTHSEETRQKLREVNTGKNMSEESKKRMSESKKGRTLSEETRKKLSDASKGKPKKPFSEEHRRKISEARIQYNKTKKLNTKPPTPHQFF